MNTTVFINEQACQSQQSQCPLPIPNLWTQSGAQNTLQEYNGQEYNASVFTNGDILNLTGSANHMLDRVTLDGDNGAEFLIDNHAVIRADNVTSVFPGGSNYTLDAGFVCHFLYRIDRLTG